VKGIGGFFELELPHGGGRPHPRALALSTGRACLMVTLRNLRPRRVHVPFYTCDATLAPFAHLGIETRSYALEETLFPTDLPALGTDEYLLWTDYFGICAGHTQRLKELLGEHLLIDDTHNFFREGHQGHWSFTSARKYFGVPDGAFLYAPRPVSLDATQFTGISLTHGLLSRLGRFDEAFAAYQTYERSLDCSVHRISEVSEGLLRGVDMAQVAVARHENFTFLHAALGPHNQLRLNNAEQVPFCYPYLPPTLVERSVLHARGFFIPCLWPEVDRRTETGFDFERRFSVQLLPLPVDHRYTPVDLSRLVEYLLELT
jgi:hypothetical protein